MTATLVIDLGGTKILAALVDGASIVERAQVPTDRQAGPEGWLEQMAQLAEPWAGRYSHLGITVTGHVEGGRWSAVNRATLDVPDAYPLAAKAKAALGLEPVLANDAHAAAWGEYCHGAWAMWKDGAGLGASALAGGMVFLTVSTGIGGGIVLDGNLLRGRHGLAGHFGQLVSSDHEGPLEDRISGQWMAREAAEAGYDVDARGVFEAADNGQDWAQTLVSTSAARLALLCRNIQLIFDPDLIVIGGGIGLADGYLQRITTQLQTLPPRTQPTLARAALGADAGAIGIAALATKTREQSI
jgi:predicted NBD/HSP70 family sugar kinase